MGILMTTSSKPKYRSGLERVVANVLKASNIKHTHESVTLFYKQPEKRRRYLVDFSFEKEPSLVLEVKGRFTSQDRAKMLLIKEQHPSLTVVMLFGRASNTLTKKSTTTYSDWCDKHGIAWLNIDEFEENPKLLFTKKIKGGSLKNQALKKLTT